MKGESMHTQNRSIFTAVGLILLVLSLIGFGTALANSAQARRLFIPIVYRTDPTATPTPTPTSTPTRTPTVTPTRTATPTQVPGIANASFETGDTGWVFQPSYASVVVSGFAFNGNYSARLGNGSNLWQASISQQITVPFNAYNLTYYQFINSNEQCTGKYDYVTIYINGSKFTEYNICSALNGGWNKNIQNLISYRGQTVVFRMQFNSDASISTLLYVDSFGFQ
jgi:hypothetical protein